MDFRRLRRRCEAILRDLHVPVPFDVRDFCAGLAEQRGRPILLSPITAGAGPHGLWMPSTSADHIFYHQATSLFHQEHIILHEVGHLLFGHQPDPVTDAELVRLLFPHVRPDIVQRVLQRIGYSTEEECEAEMLASLIRPPTTDIRSANTPPTDAEVAGLLGRLETSLEEGTGG